MVCWSRSVAFAACVTGKGKYLSTKGSNRKANKCRTAETPSCFPANFRGRTGRSRKYLVETKVRCAGYRDKSVLRRDHQDVRKKSRRVRNCGTRVTAMGRATSRGGAGGKRFLASNKPVAEPLRSKITEPSAR